MERRKGVRNSQRIANRKQNEEPDNTNDNQNNSLSSVTSGKGMRTKKIPSNTRRKKANIVQKSLSKNVKSAKSTQMNDNVLMSDFYLDDKVAQYKVFDDNNVFQLDDQFGGDEIQSELLKKKLK